MKILFLIRSLNVGGAERQMILLARELAAHGHAVVIVTFYERNALARELDGSAVRLIDLRKRGRWDVLRFLSALRRTVADERPQIIYSFLTVANILALLARPARRSPPVVWGVRASAMRAREYDWFVGVTLWLERMLADRADLIIFNSRAAMLAALASGYPQGKCRWVANGIDARRFFPDVAAGARVRRAWGFATQDKLVGVVGRLDPMKGHEGFLHAAAQVAQARPDVKFVCVGSGDPHYAGRLKALGERLLGAQRVVWVDHESDLNGVYSALDVMCLPSVFGEGFPNVVGEAMACGTRCVVTDLGDAREIVGEYGWVVAPGDVSGLARAIATALDDPGSSQARRERIVSCFSVANLVGGTEALLAACA